MRSDRNGDRPERALCSKQKRGKIPLRLGPPLALLLGKKYEGPKWSAPHGLRTTLSSPQRRLDTSPRNFSPRDALFTISRLILAVNERDPHPRPNYSR